MNNLEGALNFFGAKVVKDSRAELKRKKKNASSRLSKSIDYDLDTGANSFSLSFSMEDYGEFIDQGVHGVGGTKADGTKWKKKKVFGSSYKYKNKKPPTKAFDSWSVRKGIAPRGKDGKFQSRESLKFALSNAVFHTGLETTHFFTNPFEKAFRSLPDDVVEAYALDVEDLLEFALK